MNIPAIQDRRPLWPYIVVTASFAVLASAVICLRLWNAPLPPGASDESSFLGELFVMIVMAGFIIASGSIGALLGWLIGFLIRKFSPLSSEEERA